MGARRQCEADGCTTRPTFNVEGQRKRRFCSTHKHAGMVDVVNKKCEADECTSRPTFNVEGQRKGRFCATQARWHGGR